MIMIYIYWLAMYDWFKQKQKCNRSLEAIYSFTISWNPATKSLVYNFQQPASKLDPDQDIMGKQLYLIGKTVILINFNLFLSIP